MKSTKIARDIQKLLRYFKYYYFWDNNIEVLEHKINEIQSIIRFDDCIFWHYIDITLYSKKLRTIHSRRSVGLSQSVFEMLMHSLAWKPHKRRAEFSSSYYGTEPIVDQTDVCVSINIIQLLTICTGVLV